jgi:hypothetical protein
MNKGKNKYYTTVPEFLRRIFREILKYFSYDENASKTAIYTSIKNTLLFVVKMIFNSYKNYKSIKDNN